MNKKIVLLEDNEFLTEVITKKLNRAGAQVFSYPNGLEGLAGIRKNKPDLILLDILMPVMNGYEVLEILNAEKIIPETPVIIISNSGQPVEIDRVLKLGVRDYVIKANFEPNEVIEKIFTILDIVPDSDEDQHTVDLSPHATTTSKVTEGIKVLVVEDDPLLRNILSAKLSIEHCPYMFSNDGDGAIALIEQFEPQVIVLDLMLPGKNGFEVLADIKKNPALARIPVVVFSNKSSDEDKQKALTLGAAKFIVKATTDLSELVALLKVLVVKS